MLRLHFVSSYRISLRSCSYQISAVFTGLRDINNSNTLKNDSITINNVRFSIVCIIPSKCTYKTLLKNTIYLCKMKHLPTNSISL